MQYRIFPPIGVCPEKLAVDICPRGKYMSPEYGRQAQLFTNCSRKRWDGGESSFNVGIKVTGAGVGGSCFISAGTHGVRELCETFNYNAGPDGFECNEIVEKSCDGCTFSDGEVTGCLP